MTSYPNFLFSNDSLSHANTRETQKVHQRRINIKLHFIEVLEKALGQKAQKKFLSVQPGDVPATYANVEALEKDVYFRPNTPIEEGIERFVAWYRDYYKILVS